MIHNIAKTRILDCTRGSILELLSNYPISMKIRKVKLKRVERWKRQILNFDQPENDVE